MFYDFNNNCIDARQCIRRCQYGKMQYLRKGRCVRPGCFTLASQDKQNLEA